jgi:hypothetical protein
MCPSENWLLFPTFLLCSGKEVDLKKLLTALLSQLLTLLIPSNQVLTRLSVFGEILCYHNIGTQSSHCLEGEVTK